MQNHKQLRNICLAAVIGGLLAASPLAAQTLGRKSISAPTVIDEAGSYVLVRDLTLSSNSTADAAIKITASGVTVDLNGHQITGPGGLMGVGVLIEGAKSVTVRNGHIADMFIGVRVAGSSNVKLNDLNIRGLDIGVSAPPPEIGVMIAQSRNVEVEDVNISDVGLGVFVRGGMSWATASPTTRFRRAPMEYSPFATTRLPTTPRGQEATSSPATFFPGSAWGSTWCRPRAITSFATTRSPTRRQPGNRRTTRMCLFEGNVERSLP